MDRSSAAIAVIAGAAVGAGHLPGAGRHGAGAADPRGRALALHRQRRPHPRSCWASSRRRAIRLIRARRAGIAAAGLHSRIVGRSSRWSRPLPALLVAVVGWITLERGLDIQFSRYIRDLLTTSVDVANAYRELQCRTIGREINLMAADLSRAKPALDQNRDFFRDFMRSRAVFLGFPVDLPGQGRPHRHRADRDQADRRPAAAEQGRRRGRQRRRGVVPASRPAATSSAAS